MKLKFFIFSLLFCCTSAFAQVATFTPSSSAFGNVPVAATQTNSVTLQNTGSSTLTISSVQITGMSNAAFSQTNNCGSSLSASASCSFSITFLPLSIGANFSNLVVIDNAAGSPQTVPLTGTGINNVQLTWTASVSSGVSGYNIYRGTTSGSESATPLAFTSNTFYFDIAVARGVVYYYYIETVGSELSSPSSEVHAMLPRRRVSTP